MEAEVWKSIPGYEGLYKVSDSGRIHKASRMVIRRNGHPQRFHGQMLKPQKNNHGYLYVHLIDKNGEKKKMYIHRAVALAFLQKPEGCDYVDHIDNNPGNNCVKNLQWVTHRENMRLSIERGRKVYSDEWKRQQSGEDRMRAVIATDIKTKEERCFRSLKSAEKEGFASSNICKCCIGERKYHKGYYWRYAE